MVNENEIRKVIEETLLMIDAGEEEGVYAYLSETLEDEVLQESAYSIVLSLKQYRLFSQNTWNLILELLNLEIKDGNEDAMNLLGTFYYAGEGYCSQDYALAMKYYEMAAEKGSEDATENLGYCHYYGRNGKLDYEKAFKYFQKGALHGRIASIYKLGDMYKFGKYVEKDEKEAFKIYEHALSLITSDELADEYAGPVYFRIGTSLLDGIGVEENPKSALVCLQKAEVFLFNMIENGNDMYWENYLKAIELQRKARDMMQEALKRRWDK